MAIPVSGVAQPEWTLMPGAGRGYGEYRCRLTTYDGSSAFAFLANSMVVEVDWDGHRICQAGRFGRHPIAGSPVQFQCLKLPRGDGEHELGIRIQALMHDHLTEDIPDVPAPPEALLGEYAAVKAQADLLSLAIDARWWKQHAADLVLASLFLAAGLWHLLLLGFRKRAREFLWFGLTSLLMGMRQIGLGGWSNAWPIADYYIHQAQWVGFYLACIVFLEFLWSLSDSPIRGWRRGYQASFLIPIGMLFILPDDVSMWFARRVGSLWALPMLVIFLLFWVNAWRRKHPDASFLCVGALCLILGGVIETGEFLGTWPSRNALAWAFGLFLISMAALVNARYARAQLQAEALSKALLIQMEERQQLAREIHDGIGGHLSSVLMLVDSLGGDPGGRLPGRFPMIHDILSTCMAELRGLIWILEERESDLGDLVIALRERLEQKMQPHNLDLAFNSCLSGGETWVSRPIRFHLLRIVQELATNTLKHAQARCVQVDLREDAGILSLQYQDDGRGMASAQGAVGHGLANIEFRCQRIGGHFRVFSSANGGFACEISVPLMEA